MLPIHFHVLLFHRKIPIFQPDKIKTFSNIKMSMIFMNKLSTFFKRFFSSKPTNKIKKQINFLILPL